MAFWEAIVFITAIGTAALVYLVRFGAVKKAEENGASLSPDPDADRLRDEVKTLKDRIAVLERLATDTNRAVDLDREIDRLR